jgi:hypothetical protein
MKTAKCLILLAVLLPLAGCRKDDACDIRGDWSFHHDNVTYDSLRFVGSRESGTVEQVGSDALHGTYTVTGKDVSFNYEYRLDHLSWRCSFVGAFESDDLMTGTMDFLAPFQPYNWSEEVVGERL